mmetsp:Transcript_8087/g.28410  ORF Transcript_8087/g.28410 Transcript_8087/m.28410 type:complete len:274 (-) Transcript_8087:680-1501(-)
MWRRRWRCARRGGASGAAASAPWPAPPRCCGRPPRTGRWGAPLGAGSSPGSGPRRPRTRRARPGAGAATPTRRCSACCASSRCTRSGGWSGTTWCAPPARRLRRGAATGGSRPSASGSAGARRCTTSAGRCATRGTRSRPRSRAAARPGSSHRTRSGCAACRTPWGPCATWRCSRPCSARRGSWGTCPPWRARCGRTTARTSRRSSASGPRCWTLRGGPSSSPPRSAGRRQWSTGRTARWAPRPAPLWAAAAATCPSGAAPSWRGSRPRRARR